MIKIVKCNTGLLLRDESFGKLFYDKSLDKFYFLLKKHTKDEVLRLGPFFKEYDFEGSNLYLSKPCTLTWEITTECNLNCCYCFAKSLSGESNKGKDLIDKIIENIVESEIMRVIITGGEPLIDKNNLFHILSKLSEIKIGIVLASNVTLVDEDIASYLSGYLSAVQISLDGMKATHDSIKGQGNFDKAVKGIKHFLCNGILTQVNIIPTQSNIDEIIDVLYLCECLGVDRFHLFPLIPRGRGAEVYENLSLDSAGIFSIYEKCLKTKLINGWDINIGLSRRHMVDGSCILVKPDGTVYSPSYVSSENQYAGNIETDSLLEIWEKSKLFNKRNHLIQTNPYISHS